MVVLILQEASDHHWKPRAAAFFEQVNRSSLSAQLNISEGWSFGPSPTCTRHLRIAHGSAVETADLIDNLIDAKVVPEEMGLRLKLHSSRCLRLLVGLLKQMSRPAQNMSTKNSG